MINKCKVEMRGGELYNVVESLKERDGETVSGTKGIESYGKDPFLYFYFLQQYCPCIKPNRLTEAKFFDPSSTIFIVGCALGQGLINRIWAKKIVQLQLSIETF